MIPPLHPTAWQRQQQQQTEQLHAYFQFLVYQSQSVTRLLKQRPQCVTANLDMIAHAHRMMCRHHLRGVCMPLHDCEIESIMPLVTTTLPSPPQQLHPYEKSEPPKQQQVDRQLLSVRWLYCSLFHMHRMHMHCDGATRRLIMQWIREMRDMNCYAALQMQWQQRQHGMKRQHRRRRRRQIINVSNVEDGSDDDDGSGSGSSSGSDSEDDNCRFQQRQSTFDDDETWTTTAATDRVDNVDEYEDLCRRLCDMPAQLSDECMDSDDTTTADDDRSESSCPYCRCCRQQSIAQQQRRN
jgi:hypothetical protein